MPAVNKNNLLINMLYGAPIFFLSASILFFITSNVLSYIFIVLFFLSIYFLWLVRKLNSLEVDFYEMPSYYKMLTTGMVCAAVGAVLYIGAFAAELGNFLKFLLFFIASFCMLVFFASLYLFSKKNKDIKKEKDKKEEDSGNTERYF